MSKPKRFLIVAGSSEQARYCMRLFGFSAAQCSYVTGPERLLGRRGETALMYGSYTNRSNWPELQDYLQAYEIRRIYIQD